MDTLLILTHLTVILLGGITIYIFSNRYRVPSVLFLILFGMLLGAFGQDQGQLVQFPEIFLMGIGIIALSIVVFDASSKFRWREFDTLTLRSSKLALLFFALCALVISLATGIIFGISNIYLVLIFAFLIAGTSPDVILSSVGSKPGKAAKLLEVESIISSPIVMLAPFIVIGIMQSQAGGFDLGSHVAALLQQFVTAIGAGFLIGMIVFKIMSRYYSEQISPIMLVTSALTAYILAENLGGNGVLSVTVVGLFFGNAYVKQKHQLYDFSEILGKILIILVFVLIGMNIRLPLNPDFLIRATVLFMLYLIVRWLSVEIAFARSVYSAKEKLFMTLNIPQGLPVAVVAFSLLSLDVMQGGAETKFTSLTNAPVILNLILFFMLLTLLVSAVAYHFSERFNEARR